MTYKAYDDGIGSEKTILGVRVEKAAATLPQTTAGALFNVTGKVAIVSIVGEVTTVIQTQANATKLVANPTIGTTTDLCDTLDISADAVGTQYAISGLNSDAMLGIGAGSVPMQTRPVCVNDGVIALDCAASNTGAIKWTLHYTPLEDGAGVEAA